MNATSDTGRRAWTVTSLALLLALAFSGCGSDGSTQPPTSPSPHAGCRIYPARYTHVSSHGSSEFTCEFTSADATLTCYGSGSTKGVYQSVADFVDEGAYTGRILKVSDTDTSGSLSGNDYAYDAQRRLTRWVLWYRWAGGVILKRTFTPTAYDDLARPTALSVLFVPPAGTSTTCTATVSYDDAGRSVTWALAADTPPERVASCTVLVNPRTEIYDENNFPRSIVFTGSTIRTQTNTVLGTFQVCK